MDERSEIEAKMIDDSLREKIDGYFERYKNLYFKNEPDKSITTVNEQLLEYYFHEYRLKESTYAIVDLLKENQQIKNILVLSKRCLIDWCLIELNIIGDRTIQNTRFELRNTFPIESNSYDLIICTEILEHLKDKDNDPRELFCFSGAINLCIECNRILRNNGFLFLTTPNLASSRAIARLLLGKHPYFFLQHVREYTPADITYMLEKASFSIEDIWTVDIWRDRWDDDFERFNEFNIQWKKNGPAIEKFLLEHGYSSDLRNDTIFVVAKKTDKAINHE